MGWSQIAESLSTNLSRHIDTLSLTSTEVKLVIVLQHNVKIMSQFFLQSMQFAFCVSWVFVLYICNNHLFLHYVCCECMSCIWYFVKF